MAGTCHQALGLYSLFLVGATRVTRLAECQANRNVEAGCWIWVSIGGSPSQGGMIRAFLRVAEEGQNETVEYTFWEACPKARQVRQVNGGL